MEEADKKLVTRVGEPWVVAVAMMAGKDSMPLMMDSGPVILTRMAFQSWVLQVAVVAAVVTGDV